LGKSREERQINGRDFVRFLAVGHGIEEGQNDQERDASFQAPFHAKVKFNRIISPFQPKIKI
jgi:hypothetical protein